MGLEKLLGDHFNDVRFTGVFVYSKNLVYVRAQLNSLNEKKIDHTLMLRYKDNEWGQYMIEAPSVAHCIIDDPEQKSVVLVPDGHLHVGSSQGFSWEKIDIKPGGPSSLKALTNLRIIGGRLYSVGMGRMVYKRTCADQWVRYDKGIKDVSNLESISGFKSIDGFDEENLYIVGFNGEMWRLKDHIWRPICSPTNIKLECVVCVNPQQVFVCGGSGILLEGFEDHWSNISHELTTATLWSIESFDSLVFFADNNAVYSYDGQTSKKVNMGFKKEISCSYLHSNDGVLWSVGEKNIACFNGANWELLF